MKQLNIDRLSEPAINVLKIWNLFLEFWPLASMLVFGRKMGYKFSLTLRRDGSGSIKYTDSGDTTETVLVDWDTVETGPTIIEKHITATRKKLARRGKGS